MDSNYYNKRYGDYNDIDLPRPYRTYFDAYCAEYSEYPIGEKILDLGYVITHGFDVKKAIISILKSHSHVGETAINRALSNLWAAICHNDDLTMPKHNSLETNIDIVIEDLMRSYRLPLQGSSPHFMDESFRDVSDMTLYYSNGWELAAEHVGGYKMFDEDSQVSYPGDWELISAYHARDIENGEIGQIFPTGPCPEPWYGNPMTARIIILGNMPEYDDFVVRCSNIVLSREPLLAEEVQGLVRRWMCLGGEGMVDEKEFGDSGLMISEAYNSPTYRHWINEISKLAVELEIEPHELLKNVAVINANAYYSVGGSDPLVAGLLPSQYYLRLLVNYLVNTKKDRPLFIIPSKGLHKVWKKILGYWIENDVMLTQDKIIVDQPNANLHLSLNLIGKRNGKTLVEKIK